MTREELAAVGITWSYNPTSTYKYKVYKDGNLVSQMRYLDLRMGGTIEQVITKMVKLGYIK